MRTLLALAALGLPLQAHAAALATGHEVVICTADGPRTLRLDDKGRPLGPAPSDPWAGCAHLWCEARRQRLAGARRG